MKRSAALTLLAAATAAPRIAGAQALTTLRMATINIDSGAQPYFAEEGGFLKDEGLHAEFQSFNNGQAIAAAVIGGALDIAISNPVALTQAHARNVPLVIVAPGALYLSSAPTTELMVPKASAVKTARDLNGKIIGANGVNGIPEYCVRAWLDRNGADGASAKFVEMNFSQMIDALGAARVDAASVTEPWLTDARTTARSIGTPFDACAPRFLMSVYVATRAWAQAHPDTVKRFQRAMFASAAWANKNPAKTAPMLLQFAKLNEKTLSSSRRAVFAERWDPKDAQPLIDLTAKYAGLPGFKAEEIAVGA